MVVAAPDSWTIPSTANFPVVRDAPVHIRSLPIASFPNSSSLPPGTVLLASDLNYTPYQTNGSAWTPLLGGGSLSTPDASDIGKLVTVVPAGLGATYGLSTLATLLSSP